MSWGTPMIDYWIQRTAEETRTATVREIAEAISEANEHEFFAVLDSEKDQDDSDKLENALWALIGGRPEQKKRKVQEVKRKLREVNGDEDFEDWEAWHCSQCGSVICVDPDTGGPVCPECKTSPLKRG